MAALPLVMMIGSAAVSAVGAISSAQAQARSYRSAAAAESYNAAAEQQNANATMAAASAQERAQRMENDQRMGVERARVAESGGGFVGTNVGVLAQNGADLELSALNTRYNGAMAARGLITQSQLSQYQSQVSRENASAASTAGWLGAAGSALGTASNYYNYRNLATMGGW